MIAAVAAVVLLLAVVGQGRAPVYTQVTCMYDIKRGDLDEPLFKRSFAIYLSYFDELLLTDSNLIVFGGRQLEQYVWQRRSPNNTVFVTKEIESFKDMWFFSQVQKVRLKILEDPSFSMRQSPQFALDYYNIIMFSKLYMMSYALDYDKFDSDFLIWTDGGLNHVFANSMVFPYNHLRKWF